MSHAARFGNINKMPGAIVLIKAIHRAGIACIQIRAVDEVEICIVVVIVIKKRDAGTERFDEVFFVAASIFMREGDAALHGCIREGDSGLRVRVRDNQEKGDKEGADFHDCQGEFLYPHVAILWG